jgi:hypothetical protein
MTDIRRLTLLEAARLAESDEQLNGRGIAALLRRAAMVDEPPRRSLSLSLRYADHARSTDERYAAAVVQILSSHNPILDTDGPARLPRRHWRARLADYVRELADRIDP